MLRTALVALSVLVAPTVRAAEVPPEMSQYIYEDLLKWVSDARIVAAVSEQNKQTADLTEADILSRDTAWRDEVGKTETPLIDTVLNAPLSGFLREVQQNSGGRITEVFVMDHRGLNVASSHLTSDYWQEDEAKFTESFGKGPGAVFVDAVELDESTQTYQAQVSFALSDPATGETVGAVTIGLNAEAFF